MFRYYFYRKTAALFRLASLALVLLMPSGMTYADDEEPVQATRPEEQRTYYVDDIKATMKNHIEATADAQGVFHILDNKTGEKLELKFVRIHDPVRQIGSDIYFACTDFHVVGQPEKLYDLDFWMNDKTGELSVYLSKIHKEPRWSLIYGWYKQPRYTFVNDEIEYLY